MVGDKKTTDSSQKIEWRRDNLNVAGNGGLKCPVCGFRIPVSIRNLLQEGAVYCPCCSLKLMVNQSESQLALKLLKRLDSMNNQV